MNYNLMELNGPSTPRYQKAIDIINSNLDMLENDDIESLIELLRRASTEYATLFASYMMNNANYPLLKNISIIPPFLFYNCDNLTNTPRDEKGTVVIPNKVQSIGRRAFSGCNNIKKVKFDNYFQHISIEPEAFEGCKNLTTVYFSNRLTLIPEGCFRECESLTDVYIPDLPMVVIGRDAFKDCNIQLQIHVSEKTAKNIRAIDSSFIRAHLAITNNKTNVTEPEKQEPTNQNEEPVEQEGELEEAFGTKEHPMPNWLRAAMLSGMYDEDDPQRKKATTGYKMDANGKLIKDANGNFIPDIGSNLSRRQRKEPGAMEYATDPNYVAFKYTGRSKDSSEDTNFYKLVVDSVRKFMRQETTNKKGDTVVSYVQDPEQQALNILQANYYFLQESDFPHKADGSIDWGKVSSVMIPKFKQENKQLFVFMPEKNNPRNNQIWAPGINDNEILNRQIFSNGKLIWDPSQPNFPGGTVTMQYLRGTMLSQLAPNPWQWCYIDLNEIANTKSPKAMSADRDATNKYLADLGTEDAAQGEDKPYMQYYRLGDKSGERNKYYIERISREMKQLDRCGYMMGRITKYFQHLQDLLDAKYPDKRLKTKVIEPIIKSCLDIQSRCRKVVITIGNILSDMGNIIDNEQAQKICQNLTDKSTMVAVSQLATRATGAASELWQMLNSTLKQYSQYMSAAEQASTPEEKADLEAQAKVTLDNVESLCQSFMQYDDDENTVSIPYMETTIKSIERKLEPYGYEKVWEEE